MTPAQLLTVILGSGLVGVAAMITAVFTVKIRRESDRIKRDEDERKGRIDAVETAQSSLMQSVEWIDKDRAQQRDEIARLRKDLQEMDLVIERLRLRTHESSDQNRTLKIQLEVTEREHARTVFALQAKEEDCTRRLAILAARVEELEKK